MINFDGLSKENIKQHNSNLPQIPNNPYKILITGGSGSGKTNALLDQKKSQTYSHKINVYVKDPYQAKCKFLINKFDSAGLKEYNHSKTLIEYLNDIGNIYEIIGRIQLK